jgi:HD superfamily phosphohydrolase
LLHDISHTAFSHAVDFLHASDEQDHHERLKPRFLHRPDLAAGLRRLGFAPEEFYHDEIYLLLERPLPWLCADRLDYFLRDSLACGVSTPESAAATLAHVFVHDRLLVFDDCDAARDAVARFERMNRHWWASPTEAYLYNEFADALREGFRLGALQEEDLLTDDATVLARLRGSGSAAIAAKLEQIEHFRPELLDGFVPRIVPKERHIDPPVLVGSGWERLSTLDERGAWRADRTAPRGPAREGVSEP